MEQTATEFRMPSARDWIVPVWDAPHRVRALITTRNGGVSTGQYAGARGQGGLNVAMHCGDLPESVRANRSLLRSLVPSEPAWLTQVHGDRVVDVREVAGAETPPHADASWSRERGFVCVVQVADCMPVLFADLDGTVVGAAHAGWRGLALGVLERTIDSMGVHPSRLTAYLGPAIGRDAFQVGAEVRSAFVDVDPGAALAFRPDEDGRWRADLEMLARHRLIRAGVALIHGGGRCTVSEPEHFYSFRRDRVTGRMAAFIWLE